VTVSCRPARGDTARAIAGRERKRDRGWRRGLPGVAAGVRIPGLVNWGTPAFSAGVEEGDVITAADGRAIASLTLGLLFIFACFSGVQASEWSWTPLFLDVDLDGHEDLLISTGHELEMMNADVSNRAERMKAEKKLSITEQLLLRKMFPRLDAPKVAFRNRGDLTFDDVCIRTSVRCTHVNDRRIDGRVIAYGQECITYHAKQDDHQVHYRGKNRPLQR